MSKKERVQIFATVGCSESGGDEFNFVIITGVYGRITINQLEELEKSLNDDPSDLVNENDGCFEISGVFAEYEHVGYYEPAWGVSYALENVEILSYESWDYEGEEEE